jgi:hypothetical protein
MGRKKVDESIRQDKKVHVFFTSEKREQLRKIAIEQGFTISGLIKRALDEYLKVNNFPYQPQEKRGFHVIEKGKKEKHI